MMRNQGDDVFLRIKNFLAGSGVPFTVHGHEPTRTMDDAERNLSFDVERIVKTVAFRMRNGNIVLAALRGTRRVDYARLAALLGVSRRDISAMSPNEVVASLGVEPGSVSPLLPLPGPIILVDDDVLTIVPTLYCGSGRADRTFELEPADMARLAVARIGSFSRQPQSTNDTIGN